MQVSYRPPKSAMLAKALQGTVPGEVEVATYEFVAKSFHFGKLISRRPVAGISCTDWN